MKIQCARRARILLLSVMIGPLFAGQAYAQWQYAGGIPLLSPFRQVWTAADYIFLDGSVLACSPDRGESWFTSSGETVSIWTGGLYGFTFASTKNDTLFFAVYGDGGRVFASVDRGHTWTECDSGIAQKGVCALAFSHGAGAPPQGIIMAASLSAGIFVSTDEGTHWAEADTGLTSRIVTSVIAIDSTFIAGTADKGIFRSVDNGLTWSPATTGMTDTYIFSMTALGGRVFAAGGLNVYQSTDRGLTWSPISNSLPAPAANLVLARTPGRGDGIAVLAVTDSGLFRMAYIDSWWARVTPSAGTLPGSNALASVDSSLYAVLYATSVETFCQSNDLGQTWLPVGSLPTGVQVVAGHASSRYDHPRLYADLFVSTNYGSRWWGREPFSDGSSVSAISVSPDTSPLGYDQVILGTNSGRVEFSADGGQTWKVLRKGDSVITGYHCQSVAALDGIAFLSLQMSSVWHDVGDTASTVYRTADGGVSWVKLSTAGLTDTLVTSVDVFRTKSGGRVLFAGGLWHLFRSTNDGDSWTEDTVSHIHTGKKFFREVNGTLFLCTGGTMFVNYFPYQRIIDSARVYRSTDDGVTWDDVTGNLHTPLVVGFAAAYLLQYPTRVFLAACTYDTIYTSTEGGKRWTRFGSYHQDGFPGMDFGGPLSADPRYLYASVDGVWRRSWLDAVLTSAGQTVTGNPTRFALEQNYPNPFNPSTTIMYEVPRSSMVRLTIYDILGREVSVLVNEMNDAGVHKVKFDGSNFASGVYFCRIQAGSFVATRKLLLLK